MPVCVIYWFAPDCVTPKIKIKDRPLAFTDVSIHVASHVLSYKMGKTNISFFSTNEERRIKDTLTCKSKNLIYCAPYNALHVTCLANTLGRLNDIFTNALANIVVPSKIINSLLTQPLFRNISTYPGTPSTTSVSFPWN